MKHRTIPVFVPHLGCPNDCSFCNQKKITGVTEEVTPQQADKLIREALETVDRENTFVEIGFFGGSFTGIPPSQQEALLAVARRYVREGRADAIRLSTRPDYIDSEILDRLSAYGVTTIELGVQSLHDAVLIKNNRGHTAEQAIRASWLIKSRGFRLGLQMMVGLPGDTKEISIRTAEQIAALSPDCVRIYPTLVIQHTLLEEWFSSGRYTPLTVEQAIDICKELVILFRRENIDIIRLGLCASDSVRGGIVAGPYHPAFGALVESALAFDRMCAALNGLRASKVSVAVNPRFVSILVGNRRENIRRLKARYGFDEIHIEQCPDVPYGTFKVVN